MSVNEVKRENFDAEEFVDRFARKNGLKLNSEADFDCLPLHTIFLKAIHDLKIKRSEVERQAEEMERECALEEQRHCARMAQLLTHNQSAFEHFNGLDDRISFVASKVVHLGDQLNGVNLPRMRTADACTLLRHFSHFLNPSDTPLPSLFTDPFQLQEAASVIEKLYTIVQELPPSDKFMRARTRIIDKYGEIEKALLESFSRSFQQGDIGEMKRLAESLCHFNLGYTQSIDVFIEQSQKGTLNEATIFEDVVSLCTTMSDVIPKVFTSPQAVLDKLLCHVFRGRLQESIKRRLNDRSNLQTYLSTLASLHQSTTELAAKLEPVKDTADEAKLSVSEGSVDRMVVELFGGYLHTYLRDERAHVRDHSASIIAAFYQQKGHLKKNNIGMSDLRRDLQNALNNTLSTLTPSQENHPAGEVMMSAKVTHSLIDLFKTAFLRCSKLSPRECVADNTSDLFMLCVHVMVDEYVLYALELALNAPPGTETRVDEGSFFHLVNLCNSFRNSFENLFSQAVHPFLLGSSRVDECVRKRKEVTEVLERKLEAGIDRTLTAMATCLKNTLSSEQKKGDFRIEHTADLTQLAASSTCQKVLSHLRAWFSLIGMQLDGKNLQVVQLELLIRFHRVLYEHILLFQYTSIGAMMLICDVNEYRRWVKEQNHPLSCQLFSLLHSLCNLLIVLPENLDSLCASDELNSLDKSVLWNFKQLRSDRKKLVAKSK